jgi:hypothetical protein
LLLVGVCLLTLSRRVFFFFPKPARGVYCGSLVIFFFPFFEKGGADQIPLRLLPADISGRAASLSINSEAVPAITPQPNVWMVNFPSLQHVCGAHFPF